MAAKTHATKRAILDAIVGLGGEARPIEIARAMGPEWTAGPAYVRLRQTVRQMVKSYILTTARYGVYRIHPTFHRSGIDRRDGLVRAVVGYLEECCGVATTAAIHDAVGARDLTDGLRDDDHHRVTYALAQHPDKFCQPFGRGIWALTEEARAGLPLLGKWAALELNPGDRAEFFDRVGSAFAEARGEMKPEDVAAQPGIQNALADMADRAHEAKRRACEEEIRPEVVRELAARGVTSEYEITLATYDREDRDLPMVLYLLFESGDVDLHRAAPPEFYREVAALFGVDPVRLSRGEVVALVTPKDDVKPSSRTFP